VSGGAWFSLDAINRRSHRLCCFATDFGITQRARTEPEDDGASPGHFVDSVLHDSRVSGSGR
ncbi:hypothetical protein LSH36_316g02014, partial [Paralvinella palmiformis]